MLTHSQVQAALSARLDGEEHELDDAAVDAHVANCAECAKFRDRAVALSRSLTFVEPASSGMAPPKNLSEVILAGVEPTWRQVSSARQTSLALARLTLVALGGCLVVWAVALVISASGMAPVGADGQTLDPAADPVAAQRTIEAAALRLGLASGVLFAAWRPRLAPGLLPAACTMFAFLFGFAMRDIALGQLAMQQIYTLAALACVTAALGWAWVADRGYFPAALLRTLNADPN